MAKRSTSSTERGGAPPPRSTLPHAILWAEVGQELSLAVSRAGGVPAKEVKAILARESRIETALADATGAELAVLELVLDAGGSVPIDDLVRLAKMRCDLSPEKTEAACRRLEAKLLAGRFTVTPPWGPRHSILAVLDILVPALVPRVLGISLPMLSPPPDRIGAVPPDPLRETIAILASAAHASVKTTQRFDVNRTSSRKVAAMLGLPEPRVVEVLDAGIRARIFDLHDGIALPNVDALRALARRERTLDGSNDVELVRRLVPEDRWVSREAIVRAVAATKRDSMMGSRARISAEGAVAAAELSTVDHEGHAFVRRSASESLKGSGDGHVTPSFEIMLGPRADPEIVAVLALAAEPVRLDRVITLKLTPSSVGGAVSCGVRIDDIARALDAVAPHPVPDNVMTLVREWADRAKIARVRKVWAVDCSTKETADTAAMVLGERVVARPMPTLLLVDDVTEPARTLAKAGVRVLPASELRREREEDAAAIARGTGPDTGADAVRPVILEARGDRSLTAKLVADRTAGFPIEMPKRITLADSLASLQSRARSAPARRFVDLLVGAANDSAAELDRWIARLSFEQRTEVLAAVHDHPLDFIDWLTTSPSTRRAICDQSASLDDLIECAMTLPSSTQFARSIDQLLQYADVRDLVESVSFEGNDDDVRESAPSKQQSADEVRQCFVDAAAKKLAVVLRVSSKTSGERTVSIAPERVIERGTETLLLGVDPDTLENRAYPLRTVLAATIRS